MNGVELVRGKDYVVNYAGGLLDFKGTLVPGNDDEIRVDYDAYDEDNVYTMYAAKAKYRHPNIHMDVSGFRLENDVKRLRHNSWTDDDYRLLKNDDGGELERADSLGHLARPTQTDRMGARLRLQADHRFYADLETALGRKDSNIVSDKVDGPEGRAFRWYVTSDSSYGLRKFPLSISVYGNYIGEEFGSSEFLQNLRQNLQDYGMDLDDLPFVLQYNKRDMENVFTLDVEERIAWIDNALKNSFFISYDLDGGTLPVSNPNVFLSEDTEPFQLNNPVKEGYVFAGWSGTGIDGTSETVQVTDDKSGNKVFKANWKADIAFYEASFAESEFVYSGVALTPDVVVALEGGEPLTAETDYVVSYTNNVDAGVATVSYACNAWRRSRRARQHQRLLRCSSQVRKALRKWFSRSLGPTVRGRSFCQDA